MQTEMYVVDLTKVEGDGDIPCPKCGTMLSPNDTSEESYTVVDVKSDGDDLMDEMVVQCLRCGSEIRLVGFAELREAW